MMGSNDRYIRLTLAVLALFSGSMLLVAAAYAQVGLRSVTSIEDAREVRHELVSEATDNVIYATFMFKKDRSGLENLALLREAARRGKKAQLLVDHFGNNIPPEIIHHLMQEGVEIRFLQLGRRKGPLSFTEGLLHEKFLGVDGKRLYIGSRNTQDRYLLAGTPKQMDDAEILVEGGKSVSEAYAHFNELWKNGIEPKVSFLHRTKSAQKKAERLLDQHEYYLKPLPADPRKEPKVIARLPQVFADEVEFIHDGAQSKKGQIGDMAKKLAEMVNQANESISFETPYLILTDDFKKALYAAHARGVKVQIFTNSKTSNNQQIAHLGYKVLMQRELQENGIEIFEYQANATMHRKRMVIDKKLAVISSFNLNGRSFYTDLESGIIARGDEVGKAIHNEMVRDASLYKLAEFPGRATLPQKLSDGFAKCLLKLIEKQN